MSITITNRNATPTSLVVDGSVRSIAGNGTITVGDDQLIRLLADNIERLRFLPAGDLTHTDPAPSGPLNTDTPAFSSTVSLAATTTTPIVPAAAGRSWVHRGWRVTFSGGAGAVVALQEAGTLVEGLSINSVTSPALMPSARTATAVGNGLDLAITGGAAGSATVDVWGSYV